MNELLRIRNSVAQVLENARRCGLTRIERWPADEIPEAVWRGLQSYLTPEETAAPQPARSTAATAPPTATDSQPGSGQPPQPPAATVAASNSPVGPVADVAAPCASEPRASEPRASEPWSLPVLDLSERQQRFHTLNQQVRACRYCVDIVGYRQQTVFGSGPLDPRVCFMGEAPGADEDRTGEPFVGKAGQLLTKIIAAMKLRREEVYILNALKCRPPQNRTPIPEEIENCRGYVEAQLDVLRPEYIVCLGAVAVRSILQSNSPIGRLRGRFHDYRGAKVVVTYHPSYLLRNEGAKRLVWDDMQMLMREMGLPR